MMVEIGYQVRLEVVREFSQAYSSGEAGTLSLNLALRKESRWINYQYSLTRSVNGPPLKVFFEISSGSNRPFP